MHQRIFFALHTLMQHDTVKSMITLCLPHVQYKESYLSAVEEFRADGFLRAENYAELDPVFLQTRFDDYVEQLHNYSKGIDLPEGYVPATEFWIIVDNEYAGRLHIRHHLNDYLLAFGGHIGYGIRPSLRGKGIGTEALRLGLIEARNLGLERVLVTCDDDNLGSIKIIERNGGVLENIVPTGEGLPEKRRYWIDLPPVE